MNRVALSLSVVCLLAFTGAQACAITLGQVDDFQDGTLQNWQEGVPSPNPPTNNTNGGPGGVGDHSLQNIASGGNGPGSKLIEYNLVQWTGDYNAAGVNQVSLQLRADPSGEPLIVRLALQGSFGNQWITDDSFALANDGNWYSASFGLNTTEMGQFAGSQTLDEVLDNVSEFRILHGTTPNWRPSAVIGTLDVDNITAEFAQVVPEPSSIALGLLAACGLFARRCR